MSYDISGTMLAHMLDDKYASGKSEGKIMSRFENIMNAFIDIPSLKLETIAKLFRVEEKKLLLLRSILAHPSEKKMQEEVLKLFFKEVDLTAEERETIFHLAKKYRKKVKEN